MTGEQRPTDWTVKELAEEAGVSRSWVRYLLIDGKLEGHKRAGAWFIPDSEAKRWLEERRQK